MPNLTLAAHYEDVDDTTGQILWPATQGNTLAFNGGEYILCNRGTQLSYTASDGSITLTFGATLIGTTVTGSTTGTSPNQWDGPYAVIAPNVVDFTDEAFADIEILGDISYYTEPDGQYGVHLRAADLIYGSGIAPNQVSLDHHHASSTATGHFTGGTPKIDTTVIPKMFYFSMTSPNKALRFKTDNGDGDILTRAGGFAGAYAIGASFTGAFGGDMAYTFGPLISEYQVGPAYTAVFPQSGIADSMISFCHYFPAEMNVPTPQAGGSMAFLTWTLRYCYYKTLTLDSMINSSAITAGGTQGSLTATFASVANLAPGMNVFLRGGIAETVQVNSIAGLVVTFYTKIQQTGHTMGGWGTYTQEIETPLSTPYDLTLSSPNNAIACVIPDAPPGWSGPRLYMSQGGWQGGQNYVRLTLTTHYTKSGTTYTVKSVPAQSSAAPGAAHGFAAWPSGTLLAKDADAIGNYLMKWAHVDSAQDLNSGDYQIVTYQAGVQQQQTTGVAKSSILLPHLNTTNAPSANALLGVDATGKKLTYIGSGAGGGGISGGGVTFSVDSHGHLVANGGTAPFFGALQGGISSQTFLGTPNDIRMEIKLVSASTTMATASVKCILNFGSTYASNPYPVITATNILAASAIVFPLIRNVNQLQLSIAVPLSGLTAGSSFLSFVIVILS